MTLVMMILVHIEDEHSDDNSDGDDANGNIHDDDTDDNSDRRLSLVLRWPWLARPVAI